MPEEAEPLSVGLSGLLPGTTYYYRVVAINEDGTFLGADQTFTTLGFPAGIIPARNCAVGPSRLLCSRRSEGDGHIAEAHQR